MAARSAVKARCYQLAAGDALAQPLQCSRVSEFTHCIPELFRKARGPSEIAVSGLRFCDAL